MTVDAVLPPSSEIVTTFEAALRGSRPVSPGAPVGLLLDLLDSNLRQWRLEDVSREDDASDASVATAKRSIDLLNLARHRLVQDVDAAVAAAIPGTPNAPLATESPGMAFDRLSVLVIRLHHTRAATSSGSVNAAGLAARLPALQRQLAALCDAIDTLLDELRVGGRSFVPYEHHKLYAVDQ